MLREGETVGEDESSRHASINRAEFLPGRIFLQSAFPEASRAGELKVRFVGACCSVPALF